MEIVDSEFVSRIKNCKNLSELYMALGMIEKQIELIEGSNVKVKEESVDTLSVSDDDTATWVTR